MTVRAARSISVTTLSSTSRTRGSSYSPPGSSDSASEPEPNQLREGDPVVGRARLLAEDEDVVGLGEAALDGGLGEPVAHHAVPDDDDPLALGHAEDGRNGMLSGRSNVSAVKTGWHDLTRAGPRAGTRWRTDLTSIQFGRVTA